MEARTLIIKKEIPIDFSVEMERHVYSFNLTEEIVYQAELRDGIVSTYWGRFEPIKVEFNSILVFDSQGGQWIKAALKIQTAYHEFLADKELI